jgi:hypothetical protein
VSIKYNIFPLDNEIDGPTLLKLSESMVVRLFPTIKLEVQFLDLLQSLKHRHTAELNSKKSFPSSSSLTNGHGSNRQSISHVIASSSSFDNPNSSTNGNGHHQPKVIYSERSQNPQRPPLKSLKREPKYFPNASAKYEEITSFFFKNCLSLLVLN